MRVITNPGQRSAKEKQLSAAVEVSQYWVDFSNVLQLADYTQQVAAQNAALIELLVEKGILTLDDCQAFGAPHMEEVK